jgi:hypothetical protein
MWTLSSLRTGEEGPVGVEYLSHSSRENLTGENKGDIGHGHVDYEYIN